MENIANLRVYYNGEVIPNTHEGVTFVCECPLSFAIPCTMSFVDLQNGLCNNIQSHILKRVSNLLYRSPVQVFGGLIQFQLMPITDDVRSGAVGEEVNIDEFGDIDWEEENNDSEEEFEANYEVDDENDDGDLAGNPEVPNEANAIISQHPFGVPSFMLTLDLEAMHDPEFPEYANTGEGNDAQKMASLVLEWNLDRESRHIGSNFLRRFKAPYLHKLVVNTGYSRTEQEYNKNYQRFKERGEAYTQWYNEIGVERWVLAFDGGHRWGYMTTNLVECINSVLKGARILPVTALVRSTLYRLNESFTRKSTEAHERLYNGFMYSEFATKRVEESFRRAGNIVVNRFDRRNEMFEVRKMQDGTIYTVERLPCRHVLACCANQRLDWQVYVHDVYKMSEICKVYRDEFVPMGDPSTWNRYEGAKVIANCTLRRATKGRPKSTHYLNEMDSREMRGPRRCTICGREGHSRSRCPQRAGPSSAGGH
ncbi:hypothetical protein Ahy_B04g071761 [Arachis hypogaea]|uniref:CCHC-type domain-containing protein n=1 Tax=Arachis hypogaea TaxID=3818 RepID=A0A444ZLI3_ARAHY|nr:hypothetical protein Ahy_B04g071761 [Arachis hypogaea]